MSSSGNQDIDARLNYIIHLLEDQQNSRTNTTTEELILYSFLGVFTIYIVDSFTRVGREYTRYLSVLFASTNIAVFNELT